MGAFRMTAHPSESTMPLNLAALLAMFRRLQAGAAVTVTEWNLNDPKRGASKDYHQGRRDAYDVAAYWVAEMIRVQNREL